MENRFSQAGNQKIAKLFRWVVLVLLALWAGYKNELTIDIAGLFILAIGWEVVIASGWLKLPDWLLLIGDALIASALFYFSGTLMGSLIWVALLPIGYAALKYRLAGGLITALAMSAVFGSIALIDLPRQEMLRTIWLPSILLVSIGTGSGYWSQRRSQLFAETKSFVDRKKTLSSQAESEKNQALMKIREAIRSSMNFEQVLNVSLESCERILGLSSQGAEQLISAVLLFENDGLHIGSARRFSAHDLGSVFSAKAGLLAKMMKDGEIHIASGVKKDAELRQVSVMEGRKSILLAPIRAEDEIFGALLFAHSQEEFFKEDAAIKLGSVASLLASALNEPQAEMEVEAGRQPNDAAKFEMHSRRRIARSLHDGPAQSIAAIAMKANLVRKTSKKDAKTLDEELTQIEDLARRTAVEIRHLLFSLKPEILEAEGLAAAIGEMAKLSKERFTEDIHLELDASSGQKMIIEKQSMLFNIAVEGLDNARRHAKAKNIWIRLNSLNGGILKLEIEDDGAGFDDGGETRGSAKKEQSGLENIRERVAILKGQVRIEGKKGKGCHISVWVPENEAAAKAMARGEVALK